VAKTIEQLTANLDRARDALKRAQDNFHIAHNAFTTAQLAEEAKEAMTLEKALETNVASGWNKRGDAYLSQLSWKGAWQGSGLRNGGGHWCRTDQNCLTVAVNHKWDDDKLVTLSQLIESVLPVIRPGMFEGTLKLTSKGAAVKTDLMRGFNIAEHTLSRYNDWKLAWIQGDEWAIFDHRDIDRSWGRARITGSLLECLKEIRQYLWSEGGTYSEEDDN